MRIARISACAAAVVMASGLLGLAPAGPDPWRAEVVRALAVTRARLAGARGHDVGAPHLGVLSEGESAEVSVPLREGTTYFVVAACDGDCGRLSLLVTDPRGYAIDADRSNTSRPALRIVPAVAGAHRVVVTMGRCAVDPCRFGVEVVTP